MFGRTLRFLFALPVALVATAGLYYFWFSSLLDSNVDHVKLPIPAAEYPSSIRICLDCELPPDCDDCGGPPPERPATIYNYDPPCELCGDFWKAPEQLDREIKAPDDAFSVKMKDVGHIMQEVRPVFPKGCRANFRSGRAVVEFDVSPEGAVMNARVLSSTDKCLNSAALKNMSRMRYPPATDEAGRAVWRRGVRETITFDLEG